MSWFKCCSRLTAYQSMQYLRCKYCAANVHIRKMNEHQLKTTLNSVNQYTLASSEKHDANKVRNFFGRKRLEHSGARHKCAKTHTSAQMNNLQIFGIDVSHFECSLSHVLFLSHAHQQKQKCAKQLIVCFVIAVHNC